MDLELAIADSRVNDWLTFPYFLKLEAIEIACQIAQQWPLKKISLGLIGYMEAWPYLS